MGKLIERILWIPALAVALAIAVVGSYEAWLFVRSVLFR
jgi:hypothetical protein